MDDEVLTNLDLLKYCKFSRGESKTKLTITDLMSMAIHVTAFELLPRSQSEIYWTDGFTQLIIDGKTYEPFSDLVQDSLPSFSEEKGISNDTIDFTISNVDNATRIMAMSGQLDKAKFNILLVILNPYDSTEIYKQLIFSGFIENFECTVSPFSEINEMKVTVNSVYQSLCKYTHFSSTHLLRVPVYQTSAGTLPTSGYSGTHEAARCYIPSASAQ